MAGSVGRFFAATQYAWAGLAVGMAVSVPIRLVLGQRIGKAVAMWAATGAVMLMVFAVAKARGYQRRRPTRQAIARIRARCQALCPQAGTGIQLAVQAPGLYRIITVKRGAGYTVICLTDHASLESAMRAFFDGPGVAMKYFIVYDGRPNPVTSMGVMTRSSGDESGRQILPRIDDLGDGVDLAANGLLIAGPEEIADLAASLEAAREVDFSHDE